MHALFGMLLAIALEHGGRRRAAPPAPAPKWLFWPQATRLILIPGGNGEMWFAGAGAGVFHEGGELEVLDKDFSGQPLVWIEKDNKLCGFQPASIRCVSRTGAIEQMAFPAEITVSGAAAAPDGSLWFTEQAAKRIGVVRSDGAIREIALPESFAPAGIAVDRNADVWLVTGPSVVRLRTDGTFDDYRDESFANRGFSTIAATADGALWLTVQASSHRSGHYDLGAIVRFSSDRTFTTIAVLSWGDDFRVPVPAPAGSIWVPIETTPPGAAGAVVHSFTRFWPDGMRLKTSIPWPPPDIVPGFPDSLTVDSDGNVWTSVGGNPSYGTYVAKRVSNGR